MRRVLMYICWLAFGLFILGNFVRLIDSEVNSYQVKEQSLLNLHNKERTNRGYEELVLDNVLCDYAQKHAEYMAENNRMIHSSMKELQSHCGASVVGENIAWGQETNEKVVSAWMWSPMHRWNILGSSYKKAGFGVQKDSKGRNYWCAVFSN